MTPGAPKGRPEVCHVGPSTFRAVLKTTLGPQFKGEFEDVLPKWKQQTVHDTEFPFLPRYGPLP